MDEHPRHPKKPRPIPRLRLVDPANPPLENHGTGQTILPPPLGPLDGISVTKIAGGKGKPDLFSILIGAPDDGREVCRAHPGGAFMAEQVKTCTCTLCVQMRAYGLEKLL